MKSWAIAALSLTLGCASTGRLVSRPEPAEPPAEPAPEAATPSPPSQAPRLAVALPDTAFFQQLAADSARDAEMLERLHEVTPPTAEAPVELDLASMFDINVARYADHPRVKYYLDFFQGPARERMAVWLERLPRYEPMIRSALAARNLPGDLVYLGIVESGFSNTAVSRSRAVGMWQFMRATGREYGLRIDSWVDERRDPIRATDAATRYLADLTEQFGSHYLAAAAYNGGAGRVRRGLRKLDDPPVAGDDEGDGDGAGDGAAWVLDDQFFRLSDSRYLRRETKDYVPKLIAAAMIAKQPEKYGFAPVADTDAYAVDSVPVTAPTSLEVVARVSGTPLDEIVGLNPHYLRRVTPPGATSWVRVPPGKGLATGDSLATLAPDDRLAPVIHVVKRGETLRSIAKRYGIASADLAELNAGVSSRPLKAGTRLRVPGTVRVKGPYARGGGSIDGYHVVRRGETVGGIARRYGVSISRLKSWNRIGRSNLIRVGQRLRVEPRSSSSAATRTSGRQGASRANTHLVRRGETLSGLARRYGTSVKALMRANGLESATALKAGVRIDIPG